MILNLNIKANTKSKQKAIKYIKTTLKSLDIKADIISAKKCTENQNMFNISLETFINDTEPGKLLWNILTLLIPLTSRWEIQISEKQDGYFEFFGETPANISTQFSGIKKISFHIICK